MKKSELLSSQIDSFYDDYKTSKNRDLFCLQFAQLIETLKPLWKNIKEVKPAQNQYCICIEDLSILNKGVFLDFFYFKNNGFFANIHDDDSYGFITHWISVDELDS